jgi:hypothetical protein
LAVLQKNGDEAFDKSLKRILDYYGDEFVPEKLGINLRDQE